MHERLNYPQHSPDVFKKLGEATFAIKKGPLEKKLVALVEVRASQINGCAFCLDMHIKEARLAGERELRLHHVAAWRESHLFDERERAALQWTEALTELPTAGISDEQFAMMKRLFSDAEISDLTFVIMLINAWNRAGIAFKTVPGSADKAYGLDKANLE
ncbi:carboxymuconolactone decarboxylase family protein [Pararhizobium arenae]|uniref:carboxymuconolactone decarboxylase family protein n=1 Tax=Pararhizobium arenae TaxID=1856850 RepID=UPI00094AE4D1|nr:carboxymuconolactone decarboxylase family protein [Pararhizobium arenae]